MSGPVTDKQKSTRKLNKMGKRTRDVSTQVGKWLQLKVAMEKNEALRNEVLQDVERVIDEMLDVHPNDLTAEEERIRVETREALSLHHIADLSVLVQPFDTCKWIQ